MSARTRRAVRGLRRRSLVLAVAAAVGAAVPVLVRVGRAWAENRSPDCRDVAACFNASDNGYLVVALAIATGCFVVMSIVAGVRRATVIVAAAFVVQGALMLLVEHVDGYWFPLLLDMLVGATSWIATAAAVAWYGARRSARIRPTDAP